MNGASYSYWKNKMRDLSPADKLIVDNYIECLCDSVKEDIQKQVVGEHSPKYVAECVVSTIREHVLHSMGMRAD